MKNIVFCPAIGQERRLKMVAREPVYAKLQAVETCGSSTMNKRSFMIMATAGVLTGMAPQVGYAQKMAGMSTQDYYTRIQGLRRQANGVVVFAEAPWIVAKVKRIDAGSGEMTVSHGPISQIKMPAMTMAFPVKNPADLTAHKVGDVIQFQLDKDGGVVKIIHVRAANE